MGSSKDENIPCSGIGVLHAAGSYMEVQKENQINLLLSESLLKKTACRNADFKQCLHCSAGASETLGVMGERVVGCKQINPSCVF